MDKRTHIPQASALKRARKQGTIQAQDSRCWAFARGEFEGSGQRVQPPASFIFPKQISKN